MPNTIITGGVAYAYIDGSVTPETLMLLSNKQVSQRGLVINSGPMVVGTSPVDINIQQESGPLFCCFENKSEVCIEVGFTLNGAWVEILSIPPKSVHIGVPLSYPEGRVWQAKAPAPDCVLNYKILGIYG
jgi:hypothetical protein